MWTHEVKLERYQASTPGGVLHLGTAESQGNEQLHITLGDGWQGLSVRAIFRPCKVSRVVPEDGVVAVPWEATKDPLTAAKGKVIFRGLDESGRVMNSLDLPYMVEGHSPTGDRQENEYTPGAVDQIILQVKEDARRADNSASTAEEVAGGAKESALEAGKQAESAAKSSKLAAESADAAARSAELAQQAANEKGWMSLDDEDNSGFLYMVTSNDLGNDVRLQDDGEGRLVAVYG